MGGGGIVVQPRSCSTRSYISAEANQQQQLKKRKATTSKESDVVRWPLEALQVMETQLGLLSSRSLELKEKEDAGKQKKQRVDEEKLEKEDDSSKSKRGVVVDLGKQTALPYRWEQFLDMNTGEVYYIDWSTCKRTCRDPRETFRLADDKIKAMRKDIFDSVFLNSTSNSTSSMSMSISTSTTTSSSSSHSLESSSSESWKLSKRYYFDSSNKTPAKEERDGEYSSSSSSSSSSEEEEEEAEEEGDDGGGEELKSNVMLALGCQRCLMYYMVPRLHPQCPSCGASLKLNNNIINSNSKQYEQKNV